MGFSCIYKYWIKRDILQLSNQWSRWIILRGFYIHPWFRIGCKKGRDLQYIIARTNHYQRSISLRKTLVHSLRVGAKHWHIVLSTGCTGLYSVLQELGFKGTMVEETIIVFLIGDRCLRWRGGSTLRPQSCLRCSTCWLGCGCSHRMQKKRRWCKEVTASSFPSSCAAAAE